VRVIEEFHDARRARAQRRVRHRSPFHVGARRAVRHARRYAAKPRIRNGVSITIILGIEEQLDGTMLSNLNERGMVTLG
jgi:hypothetical protein